MRNRERKRMAEKDREADVNKENRIRECIAKVRERQ